MGQQAKARGHFVRQRVGVTRDDVVIRLHFDTMPVRSLSVRSSSMEAGGVCSLSDDQSAPSARRTMAAKRA